MNSEKGNQEGLSQAGLTDIELAFITFIHELYDGEQQPYQWQLRLLRSVVTQGEWPEILDTPTGSGKTIVIEIHVFLNGLAGWNEVSRTLPRRLILTVNRRALVDSQYDHAKKCIENMNKKADASPNGVVAKVRDGLRRRSGQGIVHRDTKYIDIISLRGGDQTDSVRNEWRMSPIMPMIICSTPDMFGSRLLFRGYGTSKYARPLEAGLFAYDAIVVIDEAHLNRQLEKTARRVAEIESMNEREIGIKPLNVMVATATPIMSGQQASRICVNQKDFTVDGTLANRMNRPKPLHLTYAARACGKGGDALVAVGDCIKLHEQNVGCVGCIMNTIPDAAAVSSQLEKKYGGEHVVCITGRMRAADRLYAMERIGNQDTWFIVGTQTLEVGLDIDFGALVTQLASGSALAQRAGRVNRFAKRDKGIICVVIPDDMQKSKGPYCLEELNEAKKWLERISQTHPVEGLSPWLLASDTECRPPEEKGNRAVYERLEWSDVDFLSNTSEDIAAETDVMGFSASGLDLWLRDEITDDAEAYVVVRKMQHKIGKDGKSIEMLDVGVVQRILELVPPLPAEKFPTSINMIRKILYDKKRDDFNIETGSQIFLFREDEAPRIWGLDDRSIRPGDIFVVDEAAKLFLKDVVYSDGDDTKDDLYAHIIDDPVLYPSGAPVLLDVEKHSVERAQNVADIACLDNIAETFMPPKDDDENAIMGENQSLFLFEKWVLEREQDLQFPFEVQSSSPQRLQQIIRGYIGDNTKELSRNIPSGSLDCVFYGETVESGYALVYTPASSVGSGWFYGTTTVSPNIVKLDQHLEEVAEKAQQLGSDLCLPQCFIDALRAAGKLHDEGKRDPRFQELLRLGDRKAWNVADDIAKGRFTSRKRALDFRKSCGLRGWRHEQRSAVVAWERLKDAGDMRDLITCLVGTSHGHGRTLFDDGPERLLPPDLHIDETLKTAAEHLYGYGAWEQIIDKTNRKYGIWGMAYLEAVLRAADMQVSSEGR